MMALDEKFRDQHYYSTINPEGEIYVPNFMAIHPIVVETFHSKPYSMNLMVRSRKSQGITTVTGTHCLGTMISVPNLKAIHSVVVKTFH